SAAFNLGVMYDLGQGVTKDYAEAQKWYRKAADEGYAGAMANLGILYYNAQGVKRDLVQAYAWFSRAQQRGDPRASELLSAAAKTRETAPVVETAAVRPQEAPAPPKPAAAETQTPAAPAQPPQETAPATPQEPPVTKPDETKQDVWSGVERIVAVGDVHGDYE